ncbi:MAG: DMT family transporter [Bacteroidota bacterium]|nr:DMT family transporter [Bacteroidota bacterium]
MKTEINKKLFSWAILFVLMLTWGSSFILMKRALEVYSFSQVGSLRIFLAFITAIPFAIKGIKKVSLKQWKYLFWVGLLGNGFPAFLFTKAQTGIDSSLAGILNSLTALFTLVVGVYFFSLKTKWFNVAGVFIGLVGAIGLIYVSSDGNFELNFKFSVYVIIATICYAISANIVKTHLMELNPVKITVYALLTITLPASIYLFAFSGFFETFTTEQNSLQALGYITILAVVGTTLALIAFNKLIQMTSSVFASSVTYLIPIVALFWGIFDGESFELYFLIWIFLTLFGVFLVNFKAKNKIKV